MKKVLIMLSIIASFFIFQSALKKYDGLISVRFTNFTPNEDFFSFAIGHAGVDDIAKLQQDLENLFTKYKFNAYQEVYKDNEHIVWAYTTDEDYLNGIILTEGKLTSIKQGDYYFSNDGGQKGTIFNPIRRENYKLYHLNDFTNKYKSIFNGHSLYSYEEDAGVAFYQLVEEFKAMYPDLPLFYSDPVRHIDLEALKTEDIMFSVLTGLLVIFSLNVVIIKKSKKVQILKLEGYRNWDIYKREVASYLGIITLLHLIISTILYFIYIEASYANAKPFLFYLLLPSLIFIASLLLFSFISFLTITLININSAVKGKSTLKKQKQLNYVLKVTLIITTTALVLEGSNYVCGIYRIATDETNFLASVNNLYVSRYSSLEYEGNSLGEEQYYAHAAVKDYFIREHVLFDIAPVDGEIIGDGIAVANVSREYVERYISAPLASELENEGIYILIPDHLKKQKTYILDALNEHFYYSGGFQGISDVLTYPKTDIKMLDAYDYLRYGSTNSNVVLFVPEVNPQFSNSYFYYDGNLTDVRNYYEQITANHNTTPNYLIDSVANEYEYWKAFYLQDFRDLLPLFIIILFVIFINTYQLALLNVTANSKKYALLKSSGQSNLSLIYEEMKINVLLLLVGQTILYRFTKLPFSSLIVLVITYLIIDFITVYVVTSLQMRNFAEKIRC